MKKSTYLLGLVLWLGGTLLAGRAEAQQSVVRVVLFYSPTCPHCHVVLTEVLPPLLEQYGARLEIVGIDITKPAGQALFQVAIDHFDITNERQGVPMLIVATTVMVGSSEIPAQFPFVIEQSLAKGGDDWPTIPGLTAVLATNEATQRTTAAQPAAEPSSAQAAAASPIPQSEAATTALASDAAGQPKADLTAPSTAPLADEPVAETLATKLSRDPAGNAIAILLLVGMFAVLVFTLMRIGRTWSRQAAAFVPGLRDGWRVGAIAGLSLIGLGVSIYMAFVETTRYAAICGPVGDCNTVQQSEYAMLFGWLPIGLIGIFGYAAILIAWAAMRWGNVQLRQTAGIALVIMALFGAMFSIYLTFLEPFVIGATCIWCLTSALCMTLILAVLAGSMPGHAPSAQQMA